MAKKQSELSAQGKPRARKDKHIKDSEINFDDIPELTDDELYNARRVGRPRSNNPKQLIAVRLSPNLLSNLKKLAKKRKKPYQTLMNELLEKAVEEVA